MTIEEILKTHDELGFQDNTEVGDIAIKTGPSCIWRYFRPKPPKPREWWVNPRTERVYDIVCPECIHVREVIE